MLILRSFFESVFLFVKSLAVKVTKQMYRSSSVIVTGVMVVAVISFSANGFGGSGKNAMAAPVIEENGDSEAEAEEEPADQESQVAQKQKYKSDSQTRVVSDSN